VVYQLRELPGDWRQGPTAERTAGQEISQCRSVTAATSQDIPHLAYSLIVDRAEMLPHVGHMLQTNMAAELWAMWWLSGPARLTFLSFRPVTNVCAGCGFDPSSRH
jgi:hypothetical protein